MAESLKDVLVRLDYSAEVLPGNGVALYKPDVDGGEIGLTPHELSGLGLNLIGVGYPVGGSCDLPPVPVVVRGPESLWYSFESGDWLDWGRPGAVHGE